MPEFLTGCCFIGIEAEGQSAGTPTLFIADKYISEDELLKKAKEARCKGIGRIYFGAGSIYGFPSFIEHGTLEKLHSMNFVIYVEINSLDQIPERLYSTVYRIVNVIFRVEISKYSPDISFIKLQTEDDVFTFCRPEKHWDRVTLFHNSLNDPRYSEDKKI